MFFKRNKELKRENTKLRARVSNLTIDKSIYRDKMYQLAVDKNIQEENNIKLLRENIRLIKKINEIKKAKNMNEIKEILDGVETIIISQ